MKPWKVYYTIRNETYICKKTYAHQFLFRIAVILRYSSACAKYLIKAIIRDRDYNLECIKATICGARDGLKEKLGKNERFLPGLKL